jgi:hypothetical protein
MLLGEMLTGIGSGYRYRELENVGSYLSHGTYPSIRSIYKHQQDILMVF